jgi:hypothetical protein
MKPTVPPEPTPPTARKCEECLVPAGAPCQDWQRNGVAPHPSRGAAAAPPTVAPARPAEDVAIETWTAMSKARTWKESVARLTEMLERDRASRSPGHDEARELLQRFHDGDAQGHLYFGGDGKLCRKDGVPCLRCAITAFLNGSSP